MVEGEEGPHEGADEPSKKLGQLEDNIEVRIHEERERRKEAKGSGGGGWGSFVQLRVLQVQEESNRIESNPLELKESIQRTIEARAIDRYGERQTG